MPEATKEDLPNLFISWSGEPSRAIAALLKDRLPRIFDGRVLPWFSDGNIKPGEEWMEQTLKGLSTVKSGLFVITPSNLNAPWIHFEAGAIVSRLATSRVYVVLLGINRGDLPANHPLQRFQAVESDRAGFWKLVQDINTHLEAGISDTTLRDLFQKFWKAISVKLRKAGKEAIQSSLPSASEHDGGSHRIWTYLTLHRPIGNDSKQRFGKELSRLRNVTFKILNDELADHRFTRQHIRACVFVPDMEAVEKGSTHLHIPDYLCAWDDPDSDADSERHRKERDIRFGLNQGLVGRVFTSQESQIAIASHSATASKSPPFSPRWPNHFALNAEQEACLHPEMRWILGFPLERPTTEGPGEMMGVLALDGLVYSLEQAKLEEVMGYLLMPANEFSSVLASAPLDRIILHVEEDV